MFRCTRRHLLELVPELIRVFLWSSGASPTLGPGHFSSGAAEAVPTAAPCFLRSLTYPAKNNPKSSDFLACASYNSLMTDSGILSNCA